LEYDAPFGINKNFIKGHLTVVGDDSVVFMQGNILIVKEMSNNKYTFF